MRSPKLFWHAGQASFGEPTAVPASRCWMVAIISASVTCMLRGGGATRRPVAILTRFGATSWANGSAADERRRFFGAEAYGLGGYGGWQGGAYAAYAPPAYGTVAGAAPYGPLYNRPIGDCY